jgi:hypothetical protein
MTSSGTDGRVYEMHMRKGDPSYSVTPQCAGARSRRPPQDFPTSAGNWQLSGEKIQWYLASELRERIRQSGARIKVIDKQARKEFNVEPGSSLASCCIICRRRRRVGRGLSELYLNPADLGKRSRTLSFRQAHSALAYRARCVPKSALDRWLPAGHHRCTVPESHSRHPYRRDLRRRA